MPFSSLSFSLLSSLPKLSKIRYLLIIARAAPSLIDASIRLIRAETKVAKRHLPWLFISLGIIAISTIGVVSTLVCGSVIALHDHMTLWLAMAIPLVFLLLLGVLAGMWVYTYLRQSTFVESRKRLCWLMETLYEE